MAKTTGTITVGHGDVVLFLGAGFSRPFGCPVMAEFLKVYQNFNSHDDTKLVQQLRGELRKARNFMDLDESNLEDLLGVSLMLYPPWHLDQFNRLCSILGRVYRQSMQDSTIGPLGSQFGRLIASIDRRTLTVVTTNYDVVLEKILGEDLLVALQSDTRDYSTLFDTYGGPVLCKLHGSSDWYTDDSGQFRTWKGKRHEFPEVPPLIIPPTVYKGYIDAACRTAWDVARLAIGRAKHLVFIGYSFPQSDIYMRHFLGASLVQNFELQNVVIIDPAAEAIRRRLDSNYRFGKAILDKITTEPKEWENVRPLAELLRGKKIERHIKDSITATDGEAQTTK